VIEVFAFGRIPLAISARCYHARLHKLHKDSCRFVCEKNPDGLVVKTLADRDFLAVNGVQTLSCSCANLMGDIGALRDSGVSCCRRRRRTATWSRSSRPFATCSRSAKTPVTGVLQDFIRMHRSPTDFSIEQPASPVSRKPPAEAGLCTPRPVIGGT
jgi:hypothetical protein